MRQLIALLMLLPLTYYVSAQQKKYAGLAIFNTEPALPFGKFKGLFTDALHPGIEFSYGNNFNMKKKHDWFLEYKLAYFYHRYVQHGIPLYSDLGYRYRFSKSLSAETAIGAGYMKSIPASQVFIQGTGGNYEKKNGKGREQVIATYGIGGRYFLNPAAAHQWSLFIHYQQRIQFPFVKSYVPFLPYNSFMIGISRSFGKNNLKQTLKDKKHMGPIDRLLIQKSTYRNR